MAFSAALPTAPIVGMRASPVIADRADPVLPQILLLCSKPADASPPCSHQDSAKQKKTKKKKNL